MEKLRQDIYDNILLSAVFELDKFPKKSGQEGTAYFVGDDFVIKEILGDQESFYNYQNFEKYCKELAAYHEQGFDVPAIYSWTMLPKTMFEKTRFDRYYILQERVKGRDMFAHGISYTYDDCKDFCDKNEFDAAMLSQKGELYKKIVLTYLENCLIMNQQLEALPESVIEIQRRAFKGCSSLTEMTLLPKIPPTLVTIDAISTSTTAIYVPAESLDAYKTATNWSSFADIIVAIVAQWRTVWTGSLTLSYTSWFSAAYSTKSGTASGVKANLPTRVSGTGAYDKAATFVNVELDYADGSNGTQVVLDSSTSIKDQPQYVIAPTVDNQISARVGRVASGSSTASYGVIIQEIQQYY